MVAMLASIAAPALCCTGRNSKNVVVNVLLNQVWAQSNQAKGYRSMLEWPANTHFRDRVRNGESSALIRLLTNTIRTEHSMQHTRRKSARIHTHRNPYPL